jgi:predicted dehydrogenase
LPVRALVVGHGSIGARHARVLAQLGARVSVVSRRPGVSPLAFTSLPEALAAGADYVVVANETSRHRATLVELDQAGFRGRVLVEKPLCSPGQVPFNGHFEAVFVAYQFRHDPLLLALQAALAGQTLVSAEIRACSYLPDWRPGRDYRQTESALLASGGGVLRDLSHELDYARWLLGPWRRLTAIGGHLSQLEIETDDAWVILGQTERCPLVSISLNYLDRVEERWLVVNTTAGTLRADLFHRTLTVGTDVVYRGGADDHDLLYFAENRAMLSGQIGHTCTLADGQAVVEIIARVEEASRTGRWIGS